MAVRLQYSSLTEQQRNIIRTILFLQPKKTNFSTNRFSSAPEKDPVIFYHIDKQRDEIWLPYIFANTMLGKHINSTLEHPFSKFSFTGKLRDYQVPIVEQAMSQLKTFGTTTLLLGTGLGKSAISAYLTSQLNGIALILTNRETIQKGWLETYRDNTNAGVWVVETNTKAPKQCNVIICMDGRFNSLPLEIRKMVSTLVVDEAHMFCTPSQVPTLLGTFPKHVIICTATLERTDDMHRMIHNMAGIHKVEVKNTKRFTVYKLNTGITTELVKNKAGTTDFSKLTASLANDPLRNSYIVDIIEKNPNQKIMLLSWSKSHVKFIYDFLKSRGVSVDHLSGTKSTYIDSQVLLGTISKVSTGFDSKNVAINFDGMAISMLILVGSTKSYNLHIQSIGRAFRSDNPVIIDFVDNNRISKSHWKAREKHYEEMNCEIKEFVLSKKGGNSTLDKVLEPQEEADTVHNQALEMYKKRMNKS